MCNKMVTLYYDRTRVGSSEKKNFKLIYEWVDKALFPNSLVSVYKHKHMLSWLLSSSVAYY